MSKGLHKVFKTVVKRFRKILLPLGEYVSEVYHFITEPLKIAEAKNMSDEIKKPWLKANLKEIKNLINNKNFIVEDEDKDEPVTQCMDVYISKTKSYWSLDKLKLVIAVREDLQNKESVVDTWSPTSSMRTLKYFLADATKHKARVHQLDFIGAFLQAEVKKIVFLKLDIIYADWFPEYEKYFGRALRLLKSMYGMINSGKLISD